MPIEPLEPDAGNAAEGRSEPDGHLSHAIFRSWLFSFMSKQHDGSAVAGDGRAPRTADPGRNAAAATVAGLRATKLRNPGQVSCPGNSPPVSRLRLRESPVRPPKLITGRMQPR